MKAMFCKFRESLAYDAVAGIGLGIVFHEVVNLLTKVFA